MKYPIAIVKWGDAVRHDDGEYKARHEPAIMIASGWLIKNDAEGVTLAEEYEEKTETWRFEHFIPWGMIATLEEIVLDE